MSDEITRRMFIGTTAIVVLGPAIDAQRTPGLSSAERRTLQAAVDCLIPAGGGMPAASAIGAVGYIERLAAREPELAQHFSRALAALGADFSRLAEPQQVEAMQTIERTEAAAFAALRDGVYEAYYTNPAIWPRLGYTFRKGPRKTAALEEFDPGQLTRVQRLPKLYRDTE